MAKTNLTAKQLRELLHYDPDTGIFTWLVRRGMYPAGTIAGNICKDGRINMNVCNQRGFAHRYAWLYVYGVYPTGVIDHINGDNTDNRIANLRDVTRAGNSQNQRHPRSDCGSGYLGVYKNNKGKGNWQARITTNGKRIGLGTYPTPELAHQAYVEAKRRLHPTCTI